jgi:hypothetical protein
MLLTVEKDTLCICMSTLLVVNVALFGYAICGPNLFLIMLYFKYVVKNCLEDDFLKCL